jgi:hypothetical protein
MGNTKSQPPVAVAVEPPLPPLPPPVVESNDFVILIQDNLEDRLVDNNKFRESRLLVKVCYGLKEGKKISKDIETKQVYLFGNESLKSDFFPKELRTFGDKDRFLNEYFKCNLEMTLVVVNPISNPGNKELFIIVDTFKCSELTKGLGRKMFCKTFESLKKYKGYDGYKEIFPYIPFNNKDPVLYKYMDFCFNLQYLKDETEVKLTAVSEYGRTLIDDKERERILTTGKPGEKEFDKFEELRRSTQRNLERYYTRTYGFEKESEMELGSADDLESRYCTEMGCTVGQIIAKCSEKGGKRNRTLKKKSRR